MKKYRNENIIESVEKVANKILGEKKSNKFRDHFFPRLCDEMDFSFAAEIGVDKGGFSNHMLNRSKLKRLYCIDPWIDNFGSGVGKSKGEYDPDSNIRMKQCEDTLRKHLDDDRAEMIKAYSTEVSPEMPDGTLDFVYIDGDHSLEGIFNDIYAWTPKVRVGGVVAGHDYKDDPNSGMKDYWGDQLPYHVKTVVDYYGARYGYKIHSVGGRILSWWFVKA